MRNVLWFGRAERERGILRFILVHSYIIRNIFASIPQTSRPFLAKNELLPLARDTYGGVLLATACSPGYAVWPLSLSLSHARVKCGTSFGFEGQRERFANILVRFIRDFLHPIPQVSVRTDPCRKNKRLPLVRELWCAACYSVHPAMRCGLSLSLSLSHARVQCGTSFASEGLRERVLYATIHTWYAIFCINPQSPETLAKNKRLCLWSVIHTAVRRLLLFPPAMRCGLSLSLSPWGSCIAWGAGT